MGLCADSRSCVCACVYVHGRLCAGLYKGEATAASSQVDSSQVSRRRDGVALGAELLSSLQERRGWGSSYTLAGNCTCCLCPKHCEQGPGSRQPVQGTQSLVSRQARSRVGGMPGLNRLASPAAGSLVMRTRPSPAVAASALTRLHAAFDQDTEPTSGPFIAVSGRHFNGRSQASEEQGQEQKALSNRG